MNTPMMPVANSDGTFGKAPPEQNQKSREPGFPTAPKTNNQLRVIVAGESGLGKTTFLNNIFRHLNKNKNPMDLAAEVKAQGGMFGRDKTLSIEERTFDYVAPDKHKYQFFLVDTPGYGDHENVSQSFQPVVNHIVQGNKTYLEEWKKGYVPATDGRTDICIYFIAAHRCKEIDIQYMKQLSKVVALIPVIGKSDSMTVNEMKEFKAAIVKDATGTNGLEFFQFSGEAWEECKTAVRTKRKPEGTPEWVGEMQPPPYAVISSRDDVDDNDGSRALPDPVRKYPWGPCKVMDTTHSDNRYLQCLLLEVGFQEVKEEMKKRHETFRMEQAKLTVGRRVSYAAIKVLKPALQSRGGSNFHLIAVAVVVVCMVLAVVLPQLQILQGRSDWSDIISRIQKLEGAGRILESAESGQDPLGILFDVLTEYKNKTEP